VSRVVDLAPLVRGRHANWRRPGSYRAHDRGTVLVVRSCDAGGRERAIFLVSCVATHLSRSRSPASAFSSSRSRAGRMDGRRKCENRRHRRARLPRVRGRCTDLAWSRMDWRATRSRRRSRPARQRRTLSSSSAMTRRFLGHTSFSPCRWMRGLRDLGDPSPSSCLFRTRGTVHEVMGIPPSMTRPCAPIGDAARSYRSQPRASRQPLRSA
jgi:hypothetical protein